MRRPDNPEPEGRVPSEAPFIAEDGVFLVLVALWTGVALFSAFIAMWV